MIRALCQSIHQDHKSNIANLLILLCNVLIEQAIEGDFQRPICVYQELFCFQEKKLCQRIKANNGQREANLISPEVSVTKRDGACLTGAIWNFEDWEIPEVEIPPYLLHFLHIVHHLVDAFESTLLERKCGHPSIHRIHP